MEFNSTRFMENIGKVMGSGITYEILNFSNIDYNKPHQIFHFENETKVMSIFTINEHEFVLPTISNNREAMFATIFIAENIDMGSHSKVKIYGSGDLFRRFTLVVQPYTIDDDEPVLLLSGVSLSNDPNSIEDVFSNLKI